MHNRVLLRDLKWSISTETGIHWTELRLVHGTVELIDGRGIKGIRDVTVVRVKPPRFSIADFVGMSRREAQTMLHSMLHPMVQVGQPELADKIVRKLLKANVPYVLPQLHDESELDLQIDQMISYLSMFY